MNLLAWISALGTLATALAGIIWSDRYRKAKQAELDSLKSAKDLALKVKDDLIAALEGAEKKLSARQDEALRAKDTQIKSLERQVKQLEQLTPGKLREYHESTRHQLNQLVTDLQERLMRAEEEIRRKDEAVRRLEAQGRTGDAANARREVEDLTKRTDAYTRTTQKLMSLLDSNEIVVSPNWGFLSDVPEERQSAGGQLFPRLTDLMKRGSVTIQLSSSDSIPVSVVTAVERERDRDHRDRSGRSSHHRRGRY
jgi:uncharacterized protein YukE